MAMRTNIKRYRKSMGRNEDDEEHKVMLSSADLTSHDDILTEILLRLPIRSLLRSKCVSKHWRSLISNHRFAQLRNPNPNTSCGLFLQRIGNVTPPEYDFVPFDRERHVKPPFKTLNFSGNISNSGIIVLHSSNGLMLCHSLHEYFLNVSKEILYHARYYVYNPTINQVATLPKLEGCDWFQRRPRGMTLAFDPLKSPDYKVLCVRGYLWSDHLYCIEIYSSENRSWKMSGKPFANQIDTEFTGGVYWNDAVHWINKKGYIFYLKMNEDLLDQIPTPVVRAGWNVKRHCYPLIESRDCLLFIDIFPPLSLKFDVHEMNRDYSGWTVKYHVDLNEVITKFPQTNEMTLMNLLAFFRPFQSFVIHCLVLGEREEDAFLVLEVPGKAIRYNIVLKNCQELCDLDLSRPFRLCVADDGFSKVGRWPGAFQFYQSLSHV